MSHDFLLIYLEHTDVYKILFPLILSASGNIKDYPGNIAKQNHFIISLL